jgi:hypothetical protein
VPALPAGIFNTTRVAGEGVALAIVSAILAGLSQSALRAVIPEADPTMSARIVASAGRIATGALADAATLLPEVSGSVLSQSYGDAFRALLYILTAITVIAAFAVLDSSDEQRLLRQMRRKLMGKGRIK